MGKKPPTYEPVGTVWKRKQEEDNSGWVWFWIILFVILFLIGAGQG